MTVIFFENWYLLFNFRNERFFSFELKISFNPPNIGWQHIGHYCPEGVILKHLSYKVKYFVSAWRHDDVIGCFVVKMCNPSHLTNCVATMSLLSLVLKKLEQCWLYLLLAVDLLLGIVRPEYLMLKTDCNLMLNPLKNWLLHLSGTTGTITYKWWILTWNLP